MRSALLAVLIALAGCTSGPGTGDGAVRSDAVDSIDAIGSTCPARALRGGEPCRVEGQRCSNTQECQTCTGTAFEPYTVECRGGVFTAPPVCMPPACDVPNPQPDLVFPDVPREDVAEDAGMDAAMDVSLDAAMDASMDTASDVAQDARVERDGACDPDATSLPSAGVCDGRGRIQCTMHAQNRAPAGFTGHAVCLMVSGGGCASATDCTNVSDPSTCRCGAGPACGPGFVCATGPGAETASCVCSVAP